jgi:hypothetical protein
MLCHRLTPVLTLALTVATTATAQTLVVDYPDSTLNISQGQYPTYTGGGLNVIRGQSMCPGTFAALPQTTMVCTRVGIQLGVSNGNPVTYAQFLVRFGKTTQTPPWTNSWATNLPDQSIQVDLSNVPLTGGVGTNLWVEWPLARPFVYNPGEGVVLDITSQSTVAGQWLGTAIGTGVPRVISTNYTGSTNGSLVASGGIKFRMVFEPSGFVDSGPGCNGTGAIAPLIGTIGQPTLGNPAFLITLDQALPATIAAILFGQPINLDVGGGCTLRSDFSLYLDFAITTGTVPGTGTAAFPLSIPANPALTGYLADVQWAVLDPGTGSPLGFALSSSAKLVLF